MSRRGCVKKLSTSVAQESQKEGVSRRSLGLPYFLSRWCRLTNGRSDFRHCPPGNGGAKGRLLPGKRQDSALAPEMPLGSEIEALEVGKRRYDEGEEGGAENEGSGRRAEDEGEEEDENGSLDEVTVDALAAQIFLLLYRQPRRQGGYLSLHLTAGSLVQRVEYGQLDDDGGDDAVEKDVGHSLGAERLLEIDSHEDEKTEEKQLDNGVDGYLPAQSFQV